MNRTVMRRAKRDQVAHRVAAALGARPDVVHVDMEMVPAARDLATVPIAREHGTAQGGRHALSSALAHVGRGAFEPRARLARLARGAREQGIAGGHRVLVGGQARRELAVARCHGHDLGRNGHGLAGRELRAASVSEISCKRLESVALGSLS